MRLDDFDFDLPPERIALRPASPRDSAKLLVVRSEGAFEDRRVSDLPSLLAPGDLLVVNDTRVISARLKGLRRRGEHETPVEVTLHRRLAPDRWAAFARPAKRLSEGDELAFAELTARVDHKGDAGEVVLTFELSGDALDQAVEAAGQMPLPPYIAGKRPTDEQDRSDYQTLFAHDPGSVAAPTAGLHFTPELMAALEARGVGVERVTLHVGAGTFLPVKADRIEDHKMHPETGEVSASAAERIEAVRAAGGRIVCVGTTSLRLLESAADADGRVRPFHGETEIFLRPGGRLPRVADAILTNFHLPRSTLLMLVAAFAGFETMRAAYARALSSDYRFYSYGDAGLWFRAAP